MPLLVLMARLCPAGAEGTTYALVTSVQMVGRTLTIPARTLIRILILSFYPNPQPCRVRGRRHHRRHLQPDCDKRVWRDEHRLLGALAADGAHVRRPPRLPRLPAARPDLGRIIRGSGGGGQALGSRRCRHPRTVRGRARLGAGAGRPRNRVRHRPRGARAMGQHGGQRQCHAPGQERTTCEVGRPRISRISRLNNSQTPWGRFNATESPITLAHSTSASRLQLVLLLS